MQRKTKQREAIRQVLCGAEHPLSPEEILCRARVGLSHLGIATVYRTIKVLLAEAEIAPVEIPGQPPRYEKADKRHHHHFACTGCERVYELEGWPGNINRLAPDGFHVDAHDLILYGRCAECRQR